TMPGSHDDFPLTRNHVAEDVDDVVGIQDSVLGWSGGDGVAFTGDPSRKILRTPVAGFGAEAVESLGCGRHRLLDVRPYPQVRRPLALSVAAWVQIDLDHGRPPKQF